MSLEPIQNPNPRLSATSPAASPRADAESLTDEQRAALNDPAIQAEYQEAFQEQLRRRFCPGCGDF